jgi:hypothetical protein
VSQEANIEVVRQIYATGCWESDGDPTLALPLLDDEFEFHNPDYAVVPGVRHGHEGFATAMRTPLDAFERYSLRPLRFNAVGGDRVIAHCHVTAHGRISEIDVEHSEWHVWTLRDGCASRVTWYRSLDEARADAEGGS